MDDEPEDPFIDVSEMEARMPPPRGTWSPPPRKIPEADLADLCRALKEFEVAIPGIYPSKDIYRMYVGLMELEKRQPASQRDLSIQLRKAEFRSLTRLVSGVNTRCWHLTRRIWRLGERDDIGAGMPPGPVS